MCLLNWGQRTAPCGDSPSFEALNRKQRQMQFIESAQDAGQFGLVVNRAQHDGKRRKEKRGQIFCCCEAKVAVRTTKDVTPLCYSLFAFEFLDTSDG